MGGNGVKSRREEVMHERCGHPQHPLSIQRKRNHAGSIKIIATLTPKTIQKPQKPTTIEALFLFGPKAIPVTMKLNLTDQSRGSCQSIVVFDDNSSKNLIENLNSFSGD